MPLINTQAIEIHDPADLQLFPLADLPDPLSHPAGVILPPDANIDDIEARLSGLAVIAIEFPKFRDGRGFTLARGLRQRGYQGDIRAVGHFLPDQFLSLRSCGFSSFLTPPNHHPAWFAAMLATPRQPGQLFRQSLSRGLETV